MKRLGDFAAYNNYHPLREIDGQEVVIVRVEQEIVNQNGVRKWKTYITVDSGETYISWSPAIAAVIRRLKEEDLPIRATFKLETDGSRNYWTYK